MKYINKLRMTTAQALMHPFITGQGQSGSGILPPLAPTHTHSPLPSLGISMSMGFTPPAPPSSHGHGGSSSVHAAVGGGGVAFPVFGVETADKIVDRCVLKLNSDISVRLLCSEF